MGNKDDHPDGEDQDDYLDGEDQDVYPDGDQDDDHLCLVDHLPEGKKLLAANFPVFWATATFPGALHSVSF